MYKECSKCKKSFPFKRSVFPKLGDVCLICDAKVNPPRIVKHKTIFKKNKPGEKPATVEQALNYLLGKSKIN